MSFSLSQYTKIDVGWGFAPDPTEGAYSAPQIPYSCMVSRGRFAAEGEWMGGEGRTRRRGSGEEKGKGKEGKREKLGNSPWTMLATSKADIPRLGTATHRRRRCYSPLTPALRYLPSHLNSFRTTASVPLPSRSPPLHACRPLMQQLLISPRFSTYTLNSYTRRRP